MKIVPYKDKKTGKTLYKFYIYIGTDPMTGKPRRTNRQGFRSKKEAELAYLALKTQQESMDKPKQHTFQEVYEMWLEHYSTTVRGSTLRRVTSLFKNHVLPEIGAIHIDKINLKKAQECVNLWSTKIKIFKSVKIYTQQVFKHAMRLEFVERDPFSLVIMPKSSAPERNIIDRDENFYTREELNEFLKLCEEQLSMMWYTFFRLLSYSGMRRGEILALTWKDIDFKGSTLKINKTLSVDENHHQLINGAKTKAGERTITLDAETTSILKKWKKEQIKQLNAIDINQLIFSNIKNKHIALSTPIKYLNKICNQNEIKRITLHGLRHAHCSMLFEAGATIKEV